jgi:heme-degrading monooxygenase HmoA
MITIDLKAKPRLQFRIDSFHVPTESRDEFVEAMKRNLAFIEKLPGFLGHAVFEKTGGADQTQPRDKRGLGKC